MRILILIDHVSRELVIAKKIKNYFAATHEIIIDHQDFYFDGNGYSYGRQDGKFDLILTPNFNYRRNKNLIWLCVRHRAKLLIMHSEQFFPEMYDEEKLNLKNKNYYNNIVHGHLVWGEWLKNTLVEKTGVMKEAIAVVGNWKYMLISESPTAPRFIDRPIKNILLSSNFTVASFDKPRFQKFLDEYEVNTSVDLPEVYRNARDNLLSLVVEWSEKRKDLNFLLRPHPGEPSDAYSLCMSQNINISTMGEFSSDLSWADLVIGHSSSSIFEVLNAGIPFLSYGKNIIPTEVMQPPLDIFYWADGKDIDSFTPSELLGIRTAQIDIASKYGMSKTGHEFEQLTDGLRSLFNSCEVAIKFSIHDRLTYCLQSVFYMLKDLICKILVRLRLPFFNERLFARLTRRKNLGEIYQKTWNS